MMRIERIALLAATGAALLIGGVFYVKAQQAEEQVRQALLRADSLEASLDTTRLILIGRENVFQRRAHQYELEVDSLDKELGAESAARTNLEVWIKNRPVVIREVPVEVTDSTFVAEFSEDDVAYSLFARISLDRKSQTADGFFDVTIKPIYLQARITCEDGPGDIRRASMNLVTPDWMTANLTDVEFAPQVCNPQLYESDGGGFLGIHLPKGPVIGGLTGASVGFFADQSLEGTIIGGVTGIALGWAFEQILSPILK